MSIKVGTTAPQGVDLFRKFASGGSLADCISVRTETNAERRSLQEFIAGLAIQPDPPCEEYNCEHQKVCAERRLACRAFGVYVRDNQVIPPSGLPSRWRYTQIMEDTGTGSDRRARTTQENDTAPRAATKPIEAITDG